MSPFNLGELLDSIPPNLRDDSVWQIVAEMLRVGNQSHTCSTACRYARPRQRSRRQRLVIALRDGVAAPKRILMHEGHERRLKAIAPHQAQRVGCKPPTGRPGKRPVIRIRVFGDSTHPRPSAAGTVSSRMSGGIR